MNALDYLLKANLYAGLFAGCYWLLLRRHTFFGVNRAYLLASVVGSLTLPLMSLPTQTLDALPATLTVPVGVISLPAVMVSATGPTDDAASIAGVLPVVPDIDWVAMASWLYGAVAVFLLIRLVWHVVRLARTIHASVQERRDGYVLVQPNDAKMPTFSFFRHLIINPTDAGNTLILQHELVHIRQWHSADVLAMATVRAVFWMCPVLGLLDRALREVHEFLADRVAIRQVADQPARPGAEQYARFLIDYAFGVRPDALTNGFFNPSLLKRRIQMMQQRDTNRWALGKYALVLPLAFGLLAMTTAREEITAVFTNTITITGRVTNAADGKPLSGVSIVDVLKYPAIAKYIGIAGDAPVQFSVLPLGTVGNVVAGPMGKLGYGCEEPVRVVRTLSHWLPSQQQGKLVKAQSKTPIGFDLDKEYKRTGYDEPGFKPFNSAIGNFPVLKSGDFPNTRKLAFETITVPASTFDTLPKVRSSYRKPFVLNKTKTRIGNPLPTDMQEKADLILIEGKKQIDRDRLDFIDPDDIESIYVDKSEETKEKYRDEYGDKVDKGVVIIRLKSSKVL